jgi:hypothetical protein
MAECLYQNTSMWFSVSRLRGHKSAALTQIYGAQEIESTMLMPDDITYIKITLRG